MNTTYQYLASDFIAVTNSISVSTLSDTIWSSPTMLVLHVGASVYGNYVDIVFREDLSAGEKTELDSIVAAHTGTPDPLSSLDLAKARFKKDIDDAAGAARSRYITVAPGQDAVYLAKGQEAEKYIDLGSPTLVAQEDKDNYPYLVAEADALSKTTQEIAATVMAIADTWKTLSSAIEQIRIGYKAQVDAAVDEDTAMLLASKASAMLNAL